MRQACVICRKAVTCDRPELRRILIIRDAWLNKGNECRGKIPWELFVDENQRNQVLNGL